MASELQESIYLWGPALGPQAATWAWYIELPCQALMEPSPGTVGASLKMVFLHTPLIPLFGRQGSVTLNPA